MNHDVAARSYRPGAWFGIFGERATVLLPPGEKRRAAEVWSSVDDGAAFEEVLDVIVSSGLRDLPSVALVGTDGDRTRVVLRGEVRGSFTTGSETVELDGASDAIWVERSLDGVSSLSLVVEGGAGPDPGDPVITGGLVRVAAVSQPPVPPAGAEPPVDDEPEPEASAPWAVPAPAVPSGIDHDGATMAGGWEPEVDRPGIPGQPPAPAVTRAVARLVFSSGEDLEVDRPVLVGRAPEARRFAAGDQPRLVAVPSPQQEISSTHLEIRPGTGADHGTAVVTDLGSTNGTVLVQPGLPPEDLQPGIAVQLIPGAIIDLGDGVTIQVVNA